MDENLKNSHDCLKKSNIYRNNGNIVVFDNESIQNKPAFLDLMNIIIQFKQDNPGITLEELENSNIPKIISEALSIGLISENDYGDIYAYLIHTDTLEAGCRFCIRNAYYGNDVKYKMKIDKIIDDHFFCEQLHIIYYRFGHKIHEVEVNVWLHDANLMKYIKENHIPVCSCLCFCGEIYSYTRPSGLTDYGIRNLSSFHIIKEECLDTDEIVIADAACEIPLTSKNLYDHDLKDEIIEIIKEIRI